MSEPFLILQIDEHTADAGLVTRVEAFTDTSKYKGEKKEKTINTEAKNLSELKGKKIYIPYMSDSAFILSSVLKAHGFDSEVLKRSPDSVFNLARAEISGDVCLPMITTTEDFLYKLKDFDSEKEAFFQGKSCGPCRFGNYFMLQKIIADKIREKENEKEVDFLTFGDRDAYSGYGKSILIMAWDGIVSHDILEKMVNHTRPYEKNKGESETIFKKYIKEICDNIETEGFDAQKGALRLLRGKHIHGLEEIMKKAAADFKKIETKKEKRPLVRVVGEFYVRLHDRANENIVKKIEELGGEASLACATEFFAYSNYINTYQSWKRFQEERKIKDLKEFSQRRFQDWLAMRDEHLLFRHVHKYLHGLEEISPEKLVELGSLYVNKLFGGETICSMGSAEDYARRGAAGIISAGPFNCMPSMIVKSLVPEFKRRHSIPFLCVDYDGFQDNIRDIAIETFMTQVNEKHEKNLK